MATADYADIKIRIKHSEFAYPSLKPTVDSVFSVVTFVDFV